MPATVTRKPAYIAASVPDLLALWHGDEDVCGYHHPALVTAVCELMEPETVSVVRSRFYPGRSAKETPEEAVRMILSGYQDWKART